MSPTFLFSRARPIGEVVEILPAATSDSSLVTSLYSNFFFLVVVIHLYGRTQAHLVLGILVMFVRDKSASRCQAGGCAP